MYIRARSSLTSGTRACVACSVAMLLAVVVSLAVSSASARPAQPLGLYNPFVPNCQQVNNVVGLARVQSEATAFCASYIRIPTVTTVVPSATTQPLAYSTDVIPATALRRV